MLGQVKQVLRHRKLCLLKISCSAVTSLKNGVRFCSSNLITSMKQECHRFFFSECGETRAVQEK